MCDVLQDIFPKVLQQMIYCINKYNDLVMFVVNVKELT